MTFLSLTEERLTARLRLIVLTIVEYVELTMWYWEGGREGGRNGGREGREGKREGGREGGGEGGRAIRLVKTGSKLVCVYTNSVVT